MLKGFVEKKHTSRHMSKKVFMGISEPERATTADGGNEEEINFDRRSMVMVLT
jgi:hypothetical protein